MKKYEECQDDELIRRLRDGDGSVMDYLMEKYKDLVRRKDDREIDKRSKT